MRSRQKWSSAGVFDFFSPFGACGVGVPCQVYKVTLPTDGSIAVTATWEGSSDVGVYFFTADGSTAVGDAACDAHGNATDPTGPQPETCTEALTAGTYIVAVAPFGPFYDPPEANPQWVHLTIRGVAATE